MDSSGSRAVAGAVGADGISWAANALARVAIPWFVLETGGSAARAGLAVGFEMLPLVLGSVFGGVLVDRLGHTRGSVLSDPAARRVGRLVAASADGADVRRCSWRHRSE